MTPKEKAKELVNKFKSIEIEVDEKYMGYGESCSYIQMQNFDAKECAIIAVEEVLEIISAMDDSCWYGPTVDFWQEVKQEIEKQ